MSFEFIKSLLNEGRDPDVANYSELEKNGKVDTVIAALRGAKSKEATILAKKFNDARAKLKSATDEYDKLNGQITDLATGLFDPLDAIAFRLVETASVTLSISKQSPSVEKETIDYKTIYERLISLIDSSLLPQIEQIKTECTSITKTVPRKSSVKVDIKEGIVSDLAVKAKTMLKGLISSVKKWMSVYDRQLRAIQKDINNITKI